MKIRKKKSMENWRKRNNMVIEETKKAGIEMEEK